MSAVEKEEKEKKEKDKPRVPVSIQFGVVSEHTFPGLGGRIKKVMPAKGQ